MIGAAMKRSKFTTREGLVMLLGVTLILVVMLWLMLSGIVHTLTGACLFLLLCPLLRIATGRLRGSLPVGRAATRVVVLSDRTLRRSRPIPLGNIYMSDLLRG